MKRTIIYARCSTNHDQRPEVQIEELRRYCQARGWTITNEIVDRGYTGGTDNRPGLRQLLKLVRSREVDAVIVVKLDRLFRSLKHLITALDEFEALGLVFVATKDNVDYSTPAGRLWVQILGSLAEFEKALIRERTIMGLEHARSLGKKLGRPQVHDPEKIVELRRSGCSYKQIQQQLNCSSGAINRAVTSASKSVPDSDKNSHLETRVDDD